MRKLSGISLQTKIIAGYLILLAVIGSMIAILLHERKKMHDIANGTAEIREVRNEVNAIRRHIVGIALLGESAIGWDSEDFSAYRNRRLHIDSLLERMKDNGLDLVSHEQIDTLRRLLEEKESRLVPSYDGFSGAEDLRKPALQPSARGHQQEYPYTHNHPPEKRHSRFLRQEGNRTGTGFHDRTAAAQPPADNHAGRA